MKADYTTPMEEIELRYVIVHSTGDLRRVLEETFRDVALNSYNIGDITGIFRLDIISTNQNGGRKLSIAEIQVLDMPYRSVAEFEDMLFDAEEVFEVCKTHDSFKITENRDFLTELYSIEMKIREIYTVLARLQGVNLKSSRVRLLKTYQDDEQVPKKRLMNEFFYIEFSDYRNVDRRKETKLENILDVLRRVRRVKDISDAVIELSHPTLRLEERFNELSRIPEAIGRLEDFRNGIAHNRYLVEPEIENFEKAKNIIDEVYGVFIQKFKNGEL